MNGKGPKTAKYTDWGLSIGLDLGVSLEVTEYYYIGSGELTIKDFNGLRWEATGGGSIFGIEVGKGMVYASVKTRGVIIGISTHIGVSPPGPSGHVNYYGRTIVN